MSLIDRLIQRVEMMVLKALVDRVVDTDEIQLVKISGLAGETQEGIERVQNYGMSSAPPAAESEAVVLYLNGNRDHGVVVVCDSGAYRVKGLLDGEVVLYSKHGQEILLKTGGDVEAKLPGVWKTGTGADWVAMASKVQAAFDALSAAMGAFAPPGTPDGGAALAKAIQAVLEASAADFASTNLKADI